MTSSSPSKDCEISVIGRICKKFQTAKKFALEKLDGIASKAEDLGVFDQKPDLEAQHNVTRLQKMGSFHAWVAFQISRFRRSTEAVPNEARRQPDIRSDDLVIRTERTSCRAECYGEHGRLNGHLELLLTEGGDVLFHKLVPDDKGERLIDDLRLTAQMIRNLPKQEKEYWENYIASRCNADDTRFSYRPRPQQMEVYKIVVDTDRDIPVFKPENANLDNLPPQMGRILNLHPGDSDQPVETDAEKEKNFGRKIVGLYRHPRNTDDYDSRLVIFFRRRERTEKIEYPFRAAVWLNARHDDVPAPLVHFALVVFLLLGAIFPFMVLFMENQEMWDRVERSMYLSSYFLTALSVRELISDRGSAATNILQGFIRPKTLSQMANALGISVNQLLLLAREHGAWTNLLDYSQLCFLGKSTKGDVKRDEWKKMNHYAVGFESFNKQFALTESGVCTITGSSRQGGGHCSVRYSETFPSFPFDFADFDETKHYLAGIGPSPRYTPFWWKTFGYLGCCDG